MKIKNRLAGAVLVLGLAAGGVAITASMASANTSTPTVSTGRTVTTDAPGIGSAGQPVDGPPPAGVTVVKGELATSAK